MTFDELQRELTTTEKSIRALQGRVQALKNLYLLDNTKFKVGDRVYDEGSWLYNDPKLGIKIEEMYGTIEQVCLGEDLKLRCRIRPDENQQYWAAYPQVYREQDGLQYANKNVVEVT